MQASVVLQGAGGVGVGPTQDPVQQLGVPEQRLDGGDVVLGDAAASGKLAVLLATQPLSSVVRVHHVLMHSALARAV
jgi:hypothetical protein